MKSKLLLISLLLLTIAGSFAQGTWTRKADFGGTARSAAVGFNIGDKGYIGTGNLGSTLYRDFWEYDPVNNVWSQKANVGGPVRYLATGFATATHGYIGTGSDLTNNLADFWEYDPAANTWSRKADVPSARFDATAFSINGKGYLGMGQKQVSGMYTSFADFWEYDPVQDTWTRKADFGGGPRNAQSSFVIGAKGYVGIGYNNGDYKDFWEYDPFADTWTRKADVGGVVRRHGAGFAIGDKGYIGFGDNDYGQFNNDLWEYDPATNAWTSAATFPGGARSVLVGFSIGNNGYVGTGYRGAYYKDFWQYSPTGSTCTDPSDLQASQITASSAKISWTKPSPPAPAFKIRYNIAGSPIVLKRLVKGTANSITLHDLQPNTSYEWKMRSACDEDKSDWITGPSFTTAGVATTATIVADNLQAVTPGQLMVSPNPAKGQVMVQLQLPDKIAPSTFYLYNNQGTKVWQQYYGAIGGHVRQTIHLPATVLPGMYMLVVEWSGNRYTQKLVVQ